MERQRLTIKGLKDMLGFEFEQVTKRILDAQDHAEKRLQIEIGALRGDLRGEMSTLRADMNRRFDVVATRFDEISDHFTGVDTRFDELKELIQKNGQRD